MEIYTIFCYRNGDIERKEGFCIPIIDWLKPYIILVAEYMGEGNLINCYNPNDI